MGETRHFDPAKLLAAVSELAVSRTMRERMRSEGRELIDGLGAQRVVEALQE
jgi:hypothetical protein